MALAIDYFEPSGGLVPAQEMRGIKGLARYFESVSGKPGQLSDAVEAYVEGLQAARAEKYQCTYKDPEAFRAWVLIESGNFDLVVTPAGIIKKAKSLKFSKMGGDEFDRVYRACFSVCWRLVLSSHFASEADAESAAGRIGDFA
jgi:hypothetical protein